MHFAANIRWPGAAEEFRGDAFTLSQGKGLSQHWSLLTEEPRKGIHKHNPATWRQPQVSQDDFAVQRSG
jgi:hypothetical protein